MGRTKTESIILKVTTEEKKLIKELADEDRRPLSNFVLNVVMNYVEEKTGKKPEKETGEKA